jgi:hypothetical protein
MNPIDSQPLRDLHHRQMRCRAGAGRGVADPAGACLRIGEKILERGPRCVDSHDYAEYVSGQANHVGQIPGRVEACLLEHASTEKSQRNLRDDITVRLVRRRHLHRGKCALFSMTMR